MFSGIVEATSQVISTQKKPGTVVLSLSLPKQFDDLSIGHSVCVNGVCLTVNNISNDAVEFILGPETLKITGWNENNLIGALLNLERSLIFGNRVHGHLVSGHVDTQLEVIKKEVVGLSTILSFSIPDSVRKYLIEKGSVTLNGVSLTVNSLDDNEFSVCLIPETLRRTNLGSLNARDKVNFESDYMLRAWENLRVYSI